MRPRRNQGPHNTWHGTCTQVLLLCTGIAAISKLLPTDDISFLAHVNQTRRVKGALLCWERDSSLHTLSLRMAWSFQASSKIVQSLGMPIEVGAPCTRINKFSNLWQEANRIPWHPSINNLSREVAMPTIDISEDLNHHLARATEFSSESRWRYVIASSNPEFCVLIPACVSEEILIRRTGMRAQDARRIPSNRDNCPRG